MASETQCVNCIELHNPTFDPKIVSTENVTATNDAKEEVEISSVSNTDAVPSTAKLLTSEEGLDDHGLKLTTNFDERGDVSVAGEIEPPCLGHGANVELVPSMANISYGEKETSHTLPQHDIATQRQSVVVPQPWPSVSASNQQSLQDTRLLLEILLGEKTSTFLFNDQSQTSCRSVMTEHKTDVRGSDYTQKPQNSAISDQVDDDDDVQFILSVTKKKRRRRTRLDHLPLDRIQNSKVPTRKDSSEGINISASQNKSINLQATDSKSDGFQNTPNLKSGMRHSHDEPSLKPAPTGTRACTDALQALSAPEAPNIMKRKNRHYENDALSENPPAIPTAIVKNSSLPIGIPMLHRHQCLPETINPVRSLAKTQDGPGPNPAGTSQSAYRVEAPLLLSRDPHLPEPKASSAQGHAYWQVGLTPNASQVPLISPSTSEGLRRRPSLYRIPQWHTSSPYSRIKLPGRSEDTTGSFHQSPCISKRGSLVDIPQILSNGRASETLLSAGSTIYNYFPSHPCLQANGILKPTAPPATPQDSKSKHPKNMLVDIAQTCQDNFPFALIAKRHNQPVQKVFDTFSAVIQLPLLRSAVDARRPGKLGSLRMKEFREMKKQAKQLHKDEQARKGA